MEKGLLIMKHAPKVALDALCVNTIRALSIDAIQKADSGHPGLPLGAAPMATLCGHGFLSIIQPIPSGMTVIVSFFPRVMGRYCYTAYCT